MPRKKRLPAALPIPKTATILEAAREIPTPGCFRLWCVLAVVPARWLEEGEHKLARRLGVHRSPLKKQLRALRDAGYLELDYHPGARDERNRLIPGRIVMTRPPVLVGDDRFVRLGKPSTSTPGVFFETRAMTKLRESLIRGRSPSPRKTLRDAPEIAPSDDA